MMNVAASRGGSGDKIRTATDYSTIVLVFISKVSFGLMCVFMWLQ